MLSTDFLKNLEDRLPELAWQLQKLGLSYVTQHLPKDLFPLKDTASIPAYINNIKLDIKALSAGQSFLTQQFIANRITRKINVLVSLCNQTLSPSIRPDNSSLDLQSICTRQHWIKKIEENIIQLNLQKNALLKVQQRPSLSIAAKLNLQKELGELQKLLTVAEETYAKAIG